MGMTAEEVQPNMQSHPVPDKTLFAPFVPRSYMGMTAEEVQLDRYKKFRGLGMFEEFLVAGGKNREAREALATGARGATAAAAARVAGMLQAGALRRLAWTSSPACQPLVDAPRPSHRCRHLVAYPHVHCCAPASSPSPVQPPARPPPPAPGRPPPTMPSSLR